MSQNSNEDVTLDSQSDFFVAICKREKGSHSFIMLGVMQDGKPKILARIGKLPEFNQTATNAVAIKFATQAIFSYAKSELKNEKINLDFPINYSAYSIKYDTYLNFVELLSKVDSVGQIACYQPKTDDSPRDDSRKIRMSFKDVEKSPGDKTQEIQRISDNTQQITTSNTCRHTAIELLEYVLGISKVSNNISRLFFRDLPVPATFIKGDLQETYFYLPPIPPEQSKFTNVKQFAVLATLYERMEQLQKKAPYDPRTIRKFELLKTLYSQQETIFLGNKPESQLFSEALDAIQTWKTMNERDLKALRQPSLLGRLFFKASTITMAEQLEKELKQQVKHNK
ncbi:MAG: hypothetical protein Q8R24_06345 [Legionellaceae bacterium]|nr:hypothetical protein [Legionellaceae bacterium]